MRLPYPQLPAPAATPARAACTRSVIIIACTLWPCHALAADSTFGAALQAIAGLGVVLALIAGTAMLLKRITPGRFGTSPLLKPVATLLVGPRERVVVVEMGETWLVLGITPSSITTLHTLPRGELPAAVVSANTDSPFAALLRRARGDHGRG